MSFPPKKAPPMPPQGDSPIGGMVRGMAKKKFSPKKSAPDGMPPFGQK